MIPILPESKTPTVSLMIGATKDAGQIRADESDSLSTRCALLTFLGVRSALMQTSSVFASTYKTKINHILKCFKVNHGFMISMNRDTLIPSLIFCQLRLPEAEDSVGKLA